MYALTYKKKSGQLELDKGFEIKEFDIRSSSVDIVLHNDKEVRLSFSSSKAVFIYADNGSDPIIKLGGGA